MMAEKHPWLAKLIEDGQIRAANVKGTPEQQAAIREKLARDTEEFLKRGGEIKEL